MFHGRQDGSWEEDVEGREALWVTAHQGPRATQHWEQLTYLDMRRKPKTFWALCHTETTQRSPATTVQPEPLCVLFNYHCLDEHTVKECCSIPCRNHKHNRISATSTSQGIPWEQDKSGYQQNYNCCTSADVYLCVSESAHSTSL